MERKKIPTGMLMRAFDAYAEQIRNERPRFVRFKDGKLIKHALTYLTEFELEMLFVWFLLNKKNMRPTIGAALCKEVVADFIRASSREYGLYTKLESKICELRGSAMRAKIQAPNFIRAFEKLAQSFETDRRTSPSHGEPP